jgi:hypothetical protein
LNSITKEIKKTEIPQIPEAEFNKPWKILEIVETPAI